MASGKDLADLRQLLRSERRQSRKSAIADRKGPSAAKPQLPDVFRPPSTYAPPSEADRALFRAAVADVRPLPDPGRAETGQSKPQALARKRSLDEAAALRQSQLALEPSPMSWDLGLDIEEEQSYLRVGVNPDLLRKLRRGHWTIEAELDLHHHTQEEAYAALLAFLKSARLEGWRCVRVIHGKGLSSFQRQPVLRGKVRRWLTRFAEVAAYCEPRPNAGGSGALLVLLQY